MSDWSMTVQGSYYLRGRGLLANGRATSKPDIGPVRIIFPDGHEEDGYVSGIERFAIVEWWTMPISLLLRGRESIENGAIISQHRESG